MMTRAMKLMIAYDGSVYAEAAIDDLSRAGLPRDCEVLVVSVADLSAKRPPVSEFDLMSAATRRIDTILSQVKLHDERVLEEARQTVLSAVEKIRSSFSDWRVSGEVLQGEPATELLKKADEWKPDLIIAGSHGRSAIGRFFLGSVSKSVAENASTSVRVAKAGHGRTDERPIRIVVGADSSVDAEMIIDALRRRLWPAGTQMRMIVIDNGLAAEIISAVYPDESVPRLDGKFHAEPTADAEGIRPLTEEFQAKDTTHLLYEQLAKQLGQSELSFSVQTASGEPKNTLLDAAEDLEADAIFVAAGNGGLDDTAGSLMTTAKCTVEIVR